MDFDAFLEWLGTPEGKAVSAAMGKVMREKTFPRMEAHVRREDGHDGTYGCKRCEELAMEDSQPQIKAPVPVSTTDRCPVCGHEWRIGDYPFCQGRPEDHANPHYGWHWSKRD